MGDFAFVPQAYNIGKLHVQHPDSSIGDFDVDRNSVATYIGKDGLSKQALPNMPRIDYSHLIYDMTKPRTSTNVYAHSNDLTNDDSWTRVSVTALKNSEDPFNTNNGSVLNETIAENQHSFSRNGNVVIGRKHTVSFYFKMMGRRYVLVAPNNGGVLSVNAWFDLQDGVVVSNSQGIAAISDEGNGWYRCSISNIAEDTGVIRLNIFLADQPLNNARIYEGDISKGLRVYGAQLEEGDLSPVISTENTPVTRYRPLVSGFGRLLTENEGTNLFAHSEIKGNNFQDGYGSLNVTYSNNVTSSFGGFNQSMNIIVGAFEADYARAVMLINAVQDEHNWVSIRIKKVAGQYLRIVQGNAVSPLRIDLNLESGELIDTSGDALGYTIVKVIDNYIELKFRVVFSSTTIAGLINYNIYDNSSFEQYDSTGIAIEVTAMQNEANVNFPSSYIPTNGAFVTRMADKITKGGNSIVFNPNRGTIYIKLEPSRIPNSSYLALTGSTSNDRIFLAFRNTGKYDIVTTVGGFNHLVAANLDIPNGQMKVVISYEVDNVLFEVDDIEISSSNNHPEFTQFDGITTALNSNAVFDGTITQIRYFDRVLTPEERNKL